MEKLIGGLQGSRTAQQELFYDLDDTTAIIGWSIAELNAMAASIRTPSETATLQKVCALLKAQQTKIGLYADEVKAGKISRDRSE